jgi:hypothetical protein
MNSTKLEPPLVAIQALLLTLDRVTPHQANCRMRETGEDKCTCIVGQIKDAADVVAAHAAALDDAIRALAELYAVCPQNEITTRAKQQARAALVEAGYFQSRQAQ